MLLLKHFFYYLLLILLSSALYAEQFLTLKQAEKLALTNEPGIASQRWNAQSLSAKAVSDAQLNDPKLQLSLANIPTDSFKFNRENMTQLKLGLSQQFPPGDSLKIKQQKTHIQADLIHAEISDRKLTIIKELRLTYLEIIYLEQAKKTILKNKKLFTQLVDIVQSLFSVGKKNQHDLIRVQLELGRLDDRLAKITQNINQHRSKLSRWIGIANSQKNIPTKLPEIADYTATLDNYNMSDFNSLSQLFLSHPKVVLIDKKLDIARKEIELVKESYKSGWGLNLTYAYRDNSPDMQKRSDFISAGITLDLPVFTQNRQDKKLLSREYQYNALKDKRNELLQQLVSELLAELAVDKQLQKRQQLYNRLLMPQAAQQEQSVLLAYQSDRGSFADVMRAYIDNLNTQLDEKRIIVNHLQSKSKILYLIAWQQK